jgi:hypothetical protein
MHALHRIPSSIHKRTGAVCVSIEPVWVPAIPKKGLMLCGLPASSLPPATVQNSPRFTRLPTLRLRR